MSDAIPTSARWLPVAPLAVAAVLVADTALMQILVDATAAWSLAGRTAVVLGLLAPVSILLGLGFPIGMRLVGAASDVATAWLWGVNGAAGTRLGGRRGCVHVVRHPSQPVAGCRHVSGRGGDVANDAAASRRYNALMAIDQPLRQGEYALRGDYHRDPDPGLGPLPHLPREDGRGTSVSRQIASGHDRARRRMRRRPVGGGVRRPAVDDGRRRRLRVADVTRASLTALPFPDGYFAQALCLDVLEHLSYEDQARALGELSRVLRPDGQLLVSVPNLAHLQSRVQFLLRGRLIRTASPAKHPGDRPIVEYPGTGRRCRVRARVAPRDLPDSANTHPADSGDTRRASNRCIGS